MFASQALAPYVPQEEWRVIPVHVFQSDHRLIGATIATRPNRLLAQRFCWNLDQHTSGRLRQGVSRGLAKLSTEVALPDETSTEEYAVRCSDAITNGLTMCSNSGPRHPSSQPAKGRLQSGKGSRAYQICAFNRQKSQKEVPSISFDY